MPTGYMVLLVSVSFYVVYLMFKKEFDKLVPSPSLDLQLPA